ncbi:MAG: undecaprenyl-diphosphate phosphatase [Deltaproteobacteria bacterium]|jgi:undecaprenyl-diphosphatase|nr:undecaprenyl-diphosphate phosphatase [Deltaproteobacteria bacterium]
MPELFSAIILGLIEGLTEFVPVSSTGHLILASALMNLNGAAINTFEIFIQLGAILAVVVLYRQKFVALCLPSKKDKAPAPKRHFAGLWGLWLLFLTCLPAGILGLFAHKLIKQHLFTPLTVALALALGAIFMLLLERYKKPPSYNNLDELTPKMALGIGFFQCLSLWPGFSRSAATIMGGMILGAERKIAADYSFIAAVPIMFAATLFDLYKNFENISPEYILFFAVGFVVAFFSALLAIKFFITILGRLGLIPFAWYRLALAPLVYLWFA